MSSYPNPSYVTNPSDFGISSVVNGQLYRGNPELGWNPFAGRYYYPGEREQAVFEATGHPAYQKQEKKQMFVITVTKTKSGHVGQVSYGDRIVWESSPFSTAVTEGDKTVSPHQLAMRAADNAVDTALDNVFKEIPSV